MNARDLDTLVVSVQHDLIGRQSAQIRLEKESLGDVPDVRRPLTSPRKERMGSVGRKPRIRETLKRYD